MTMNGAIQIALKISRRSCCNLIVSDVGDNQKLVFIKESLYKGLSFVCKRKANYEQSKNSC